MLVLKCFPLGRAIWSDIVGCWLQHCDASQALRTAIIVPNGSHVLLNNSHFNQVCGAGARSILRAGTICIDGQSCPCIYRTTRSSSIYFQGACPNNSTRLPIHSWHQLRWGPHLRHNVECDGDGTRGCHRGHCTCRCCQMDCWITTCHPQTMNPGVSADPACASRDTLAALQGYGTQCIA